MESYLPLPLGRNETGDGRNALSPPDIFRLSAHAAFRTYESTLPRVVLRDKVTCGHRCATTHQWPHLTEETSHLWYGRMLGFKTNRFSFAYFARRSQGSCSKIVGSSAETWEFPRRGPVWL